MEKTRKQSNMCACIFLTRYLYSYDNWQQSVVQAPVGSGQVIVPLSCLLSRLASHSNCIWMRYRYRLFAIVVVSLFLTRSSIQNIKHCRHLFAREVLERTAVAWRRCAKLTRLALKLEITRNLARPFEEIKEIYSLNLHYYSHSYFCSIKVVAIALIAFACLMRYTE